MLKSFRVLLVLSLTSIWIAGCASSQMKARKEQRDKVSQTAKLYCDFVNGEVYPDVEVQLNLEMAKRCDSSQPYSITNYKTSNENMGITYCCALPDSTGAEAKAKLTKPAPAAPAPVLAKSEPKAAEAAKPEAKPKAEAKPEAKAQPKAEPASGEAEPEI